MLGIAPTRKMPQRHLLVWNEDDAMGYGLVPDNNEVQTCRSSLFNLSGVTNLTVKGIT